MNNRLNKITSVFLLCLFLLSCGDGETLSGGNADELAIEDASALVGIYKGTEKLKLILQADSEVKDEQENEAQLLVNSDGVVSLSTAAGSSGQAQIRQNRTFELTAQANINFSGRCKSGQVVLKGRFEDNKIVGEYSSINLVCDGEAYRIEGTLEATKN